MLNKIIKEIKQIIMSFKPSQRVKIKNSDFRRDIFENVTYKNILNYILNDIRLSEMLWSLGLEYKILMRKDGSYYFIVTGVHYGLICEYGIYCGFADEFKNKITNLLISVQNIKKKFEDKLTLLYKNFKKRNTDYTNICLNDLYDHKFMGFINSILMLVEHYKLKELIFSTNRLYADVNHYLYCISRDYEFIPEYSMKWFLRKHDYDQYSTLIKYMSVEHMEEFVNLKTNRIRGKYGFGIKK